MPLLKSICIGLLASLLASAAAASAADGLSEIRGLVVKTMNVTGYTYVQLDTAEGVLWAAAPRVEVRVGDDVLLTGAAPMSEFYSSSLERRFEEIHFAASLEVIRKDGSITVDLQLHCPPAGQQGDAFDFSGIEKAAGGRTVREVIEGKKELAGEQVTVRGKVVKFSSGILGKNWLHLQDGTAGPDGVADLAVTTIHAVTIGCTVLVRGTVVTDADFGYGYKYDLLIEDATITKD